jgi:anti-sigma B factor antagonist
VSEPAYDDAAWFAETGEQLTAALVDPFAVEDALLAVRQRASEVLPGGGPQTEFTSRRIGDIGILTVHGDFDTHTAARARELLVELTGAGCAYLVVDLRQGTTIDDTAMGVMIGSLKRARNNGGTLVVVSTDAHVLKQLRVTGIDSVLKPLGSLAAAVVAIEAARNASAEEPRI